MTIYDVPSDKLVREVAKELKLEMPAWAIWVKTGMHKERPPVEKDWWNVRAASLLRKVMIMGTIGTNKLRNKYGGSKQRGYKPEHHYPASGKIIRTILQQLDKAGYTKVEDKKARKGRKITPKGMKLLNAISDKIQNGVTQTSKQEKTISKSSKTN